MRAVTHEMRALPPDCQKPLVTAVDIVHYRSGCVSFIFVRVHFACFSHAYFSYLFLILALLIVSHVSFSCLFLILNFMIPPCAISPNAHQSRCCSRRNGTLTLTMALSQMGGYLQTKIIPQPCESWVSCEVPLVVNDDCFSTLGRCYESHFDACSSEIDERVDQTHRQRYAQNEEHRSYPRERSCQIMRFRLLPPQIDNDTPLKKGAAALNVQKYLSKLKDRHTLRTRY